MFKRLRARGRMRKVIANQSFLDGTERFEAGGTYRVDKARAAYFARNGWIVGGEAASTEHVTLAIEPSAHGHEGGEL